MKPKKIQNGKHCCFATERFAKALIWSTFGRASTMTIETLRKRATSSSKE